MGHILLLVRPSVDPARPNMASYSSRTFSLRFGVRCGFCWGFGPFPEIDGPPHDANGMVLQREKLGCGHVWGGGWWEGGREGNDKGGTEADGDFAHRSRMLSFEAEMACVKAAGRP